ncbi:hypothetical protein FN846DRAFT_910613 [Sphaerosporella brunnea]|uniref:Uncharacterized protein n=1 Tax=Sphaerosporella brunnea TaxID=1250544 RepID=A0A5J5ENY4_9PEZI|nr:hypothetical protein FN846DRAFT_910613 [Sphaerosporella brunnea]
MTTTNRPATGSSEATGRGTPLQTAEIVVSLKTVKLRIQKMDIVYAQTGGVIIPATICVAMDLTLNQMVIKDRPYDVSSTRNDGEGLLFDLALRNGSSALQGTLKKAIKLIWPPRLLRSSSRWTHGGSRAV